MAKKNSTLSNDEKSVIKIQIPSLTTQGYTNKGVATQKLERKISDAYHNYPIKKSRYTSFYSSGMKEPIRYLVHLIKNKSD